MGLEGGAESQGIEVVATLGEVDRVRRIRVLGGGVVMKEVQAAGMGKGGEGEADGHRQ
jgi:hypothetical protein